MKTGNYKKMIDMLYDVYKSDDVNGIDKYFIANAMRELFKLMPFVYFGDYNQVKNKQL